MITGYTGGEDYKSSPQSQSNLTVGSDRTAIPDLDCGIYDVPPYFFASATTTTHSFYCQVVPDSQFWTDLNQMVAHIDNILSSGNQFHHNALIAEIDYVIVGLRNTIEHGYKLKKVEETNVYEAFFESLENMIIYLNAFKEDMGDYSFKDFQETILSTMKMGYVLTNGIYMKRTDIYKCIDGERDYQDANWGSRRQLDGTPDNQKPVAEWINYIEFHLNKAKEKVYHLDTLAATAELRKVAALAVRAMEIHGCPERQKGEILNPLSMSSNGTATMGTTSPETKLEIKSCKGDCNCKKQ